MVFGELSPPGVVPTPGVLQAAQQPAANPPQEAAPGAKVEEAERSEVSTLQGLKVVLFAKAERAAEWRAAQRSAWP